jgi:pimeloyl-ACP methyl ester carboxylesterase
MVRMRAGSDRLAQKGRNKMRMAILSLAAAMLLAGGALAQERTRSLVKYDNVEIDVITEGRGPLIVLLPSRGRDSEDYDEVAAGLAREGFRVLRPQPRGMHASKGPLKDITLHDLARDVATVIERENAGPAVIVGHAYGNWVARMTAVDHPKLVRGVVLAAAAAKKFPPRLSQLVSKSADMAVPEAERLAAMQEIFFATGSDPKIWLKGWWTEASEGQRVAAANVKQSDWWAAGNVPLFDLQAAVDPFKPKGTENELKDEFPDRVTIAVIPNASHALLPEQPAAVVEAIATWVRKLPPAGP